ncbi:MAG TPA: rhodanese-like domain-containing protein [Terriglobales bacterium]|nr:rhodanese-like domain-containing protein [Terriglobales bacterium]
MTLGKDIEFEISARDVKASLDNGQRVTLVDVREPWEYATARIENSKHIPMNDIPARAGTELAPNDHIVVICHHGVRSARVTAWLREHGFERAQSMRGGIDLWSRTIDPQVPLY